MTDARQPAESTGSEDEVRRLARWAQEALNDTKSKGAQPFAKDHSTEIDLLLNGSYHVRFYQQLPDLVMALLEQDPQVTVRYAPLLFHLAGCSECHSAYLDLYDAMRAAVYPQGPRPLLGQGTRTLSATPQRMLSHLCRALISQAEAIMLHTGPTPQEGDDNARSLLQLALRIDARITQSNVRQEALRDLVRVASLFQEVQPRSEEHSYYAYTPMPAGSGKTVRGAETNARERESTFEQPMLLHAGSLRASITQSGDRLDLHLQDIGEELRGHYVTISVPLGSLLEPVRWRGGNPLAIRSATPVTTVGTLTTPLGETELRLHIPEERNQLEALFFLLEVRVADDPTV